MSEVHTSILSLVEPASSLGSFPPARIHPMNWQTCTCHLLTLSIVFQGLGMADAWVIWVIKKQEDVIPASDPVVSNKAINHFFRNTLQHTGYGQAMLVNIWPNLQILWRICIQPPTIIQGHLGICRWLQANGFDPQVHRLPAPGAGIFLHRHLFQDFFPVLLWIIREERHICPAMSRRIVKSFRDVKFQPGPGLL